MKMKMNLGEGGIKGFLARHCEKIVFGVAALLAVWMMLPSSKYTPLDESKSGPEALQTKATNATAKLSSDSWPTIREKRFDQPDNFIERGERGTVRVEPDAYAAPVPLAKPLFPLDKKREDPQLYPPEKLEVAVDYGALAIVDSDAEVGGGRRLLDAGGGDGGRPVPPKIQQELKDAGALVSISGAKPKPTYIVKLTAEIPVRKQRLEYERLFRDAADYEPQRDTPHYGAGHHDEFGMYYFVVARAEVGPDGQPGPFNYVRDSTHAMAEQATWANVPNGEIVDPNYTNPNFTSKLPPLMLRDLRKLATHSEIPLAGATADESETEEEGDTTTDETDTGVGPRVGPGAGPGPGAAPTPSPRTTRPAPRTGRGEFGDEGGSRRAEEAKVWLFRYYDTNVQPGKSYVYKIKLFLEDPNNPRTVNPNAAVGRGPRGGAAEGAVHKKPPTAALDKSVIERLRKIKDPVATWWLDTGDSEVSPIVHIPSTDRVLAGSIDNGDVVQFRDKEFEVRRTEKMAKMMALVWAKDKGLDVPGIVNAARGAVLNFKADAEAIDPFQSSLVTLPEHVFNTNSIVLDIHGGQPFARKDPLAVPGEVLLMDEHGNLIVHNELEDQEAFQSHDFPAPAAVEEPAEGEAPAARPRPPAGEGGINIFGG